MRRFAKSVIHAAQGLRYTGETESNFRLELIVAVLVALLTWMLPVTQQEELFIVLTVAGVLTLELINTAIERVVDMLKPRVHPYARIAKDVMAAAVLVSSLGAVMVGCIIFLPYIARLL